MFLYYTVFMDIIVIVLRILDSDLVRLLTLPYFLR